MNNRVMSREAAEMILSSVSDQRLAEIFNNTATLPFSQQAITFNLSTAKNSADPFEVGFPFKSFYVQDATDTNVTAYFRPVSRDELQSPLTIRKNDCWTSNKYTNKCYLHWDAQAGKTMTVVFFTDAEFKSGSQISVTGGGVSIVDGSSVSIGAQVTLTAATRGIIAPALSTRKKATIQNKTGGDLYIGDSTVTVSGANEGIKVGIDQIIYWSNTAALYGISTPGGVVSRLEEA